MGRFTLAKELGAGGMATVYLSKMKLAAGLERLVAVKTIHSHLAKQQTFVDMFLDEAKIASHISHPNVCSVYDFGDVGGIYFIAMEYLIGEPLIDIVNAIVDARDDALLEDVAFLGARIIADSCEGLHAAHSLRGSDGKPLRVIHRDVSPQNLFVTYEGAVKVVDFGCAKALERVTQTNTGVMKGKVSYAAPEQLQGKDIDARVDVFALGICLWECLTLRNLFRRENAILTAQAVLSADIPRADDGCPWIPRELADICEKALQRDREGRFGTAREMGRALRAFIASSGVTFESAEVADFMGQLFSDRHDDTMRVLGEVEQIEVSQVSVVADTPAQPEQERQRAIADAHTKLAKTPAAGEHNVWQLEESRVEEDDPVVLPTSTGRYVAALLFVVCLLAGGVYAYQYHREPILTALGIPLEEPGGEASPDVADGPELPPLGQTSAAAGDETPEPAANDGSEEGETAEETEATATTEAETPATAASGTEASGRSRRHRRSQDPTHETRTPAASEAPTEARPDEHEIVRPSRTLDFSQGTVRVVARGGFAIVEHNGRTLGRTPLRVRLPVGRQTLRILPNGELPARVITIEIAWGETAEITVPISATEGWDNPY